VVSSVAAVVVRWKSGPEIERCLAALLEHTGDRLTEVVMVDSGSGDGGAERLAAAFPAVRMLALDENLSFAWAADRGAEATGASYLLLLNPDCEVHPRAVETLAGFLDQNPSAAGAVPLLVDPGGTRQHAWQLRRLPTVGRLITGRPGAPAFGRAPAAPRPVAQPAAAAWLVRRAVWQALGGLDPRYAPAWWEDADLCVRLSRRLADPAFPADTGFWVVPAATVLHHGGSSLAHLSDASFLTMYYRNLLVYAGRHHPGSAGLVAIGVRLSLLVRACARPGRARAYLGALGQL
jgi:GT2 family glycosyltransferase